MAVFEVVISLWKIFLSINEIYLKLRENKITYKTSVAFKNHRAI